MKNLIIFVLLLLLSCASTSIQMTGQARTAISRSEVKKYKVIPENAQEIGIVTVSLQSNFGGAEANGEIRTQAAPVGANGYKIIERNASGSGMDAFGKPMARSYEVRAVVFYVPE